MADKYRKVFKPKEVIPDHEIRVKKNQRIGRYLRRAFKLLKEENQTQVLVKGVKEAIESAV